MVFVGYIAVSYTVYLCSIMDRCWIYISGGIEQFKNGKVIDKGTSNDGEAASPTQEEGRGSRFRASDQTFMLIFVIKLR